MVLVEKQTLSATAKYRPSDPVKTDPIFVFKRSRVHT